MEQHSHNSLENYFDDNRENDEEEENVSIDK